MNLSKEIFQEYLNDTKEKKTAVDALTNFAEYFDERVYFSVDTKNIRRKKMKLVIPAVAFIDDKNILSKVMEQCADKVERKILDKKISRLSNIEISVLEEKFIKLYAKENFEFALKYGNELFLRDKNKFIKIISSFVLIDNIFSQKSLMLLSFMNLPKITCEIFYLFMSYMIKARADFSDWENYERKNFEKNSGQNNLENLRAKILEEKELLNSYEGLAVLSYFCLLKTLEEKDEKYLNILADKISQLKLSDKNSEQENFESEKFQQEKNETIKILVENLVKKFL
ncbi:MAG: hypothetical protein ACRCSK_08490 [Fusobacteriaceae bacterium]